MSDKETKEIICPYCGFEFSDSCDMIGDNETFQKIVCEQCHKQFKFQTILDIKFRSFVDLDSK
jgi:uncharacterized Zn-finger protein